MEIIFKLISISIALIIYGIDKFYERDKRIALNKFLRRTVFVAILMSIVLASPYISEWINNDKKQKNIMQEITNELGNNLEIANKLEKSINDGYPWNEKFNTIYFDVDALSYISDGKLKQEIANCYKKGTYIGARIDFLRIGKYEGKDEKNRIKMELDEFVINIGHVLKELQKKGCNISKVRSSVNKNDSDEETYSFFKADFDGQAISSDPSVSISENLPQQTSDNQILQTK